MKAFIPSLFCLSLISCTGPQFIQFNENGTPKLAVNNWSILTKSDVDDGEMTLPGGYTMKRTIRKKNEVSVPNNYIMKEGLVEMADITAGVSKFNTANDTKRAAIGANQAVSLEKIKSAPAPIVP